MTYAEQPQRLRRTLLLGMAAAPALGWTGCASLRGFPSPEISEEVPSDLRPILAPPVVNKAPGAPKFVRDVHAHFFNARDVPVECYLSGPVAHSKGGIIGELLKALAPMADWLASEAPSAFDEFQDLKSRARVPQLIAMGPPSLQASLMATRDEYVRNLSRRVYDKLKDNSDFTTLYNEAQRAGRSARTTQGVVPLAVESLDEGSLERAMRRDRERSGLHVESFDSSEPPPYADGVLAFVGYMLSYRWMNLLAYQDAFTSGEGVFGVDEVNGALVDFDHWLTPPPARTAHEDQIRLHQLLSQLSGGYMRPLVAYNPWSAARDNGRTLARVLEALDVRGFVGVKIYPPNGFRPYGNAVHGLPVPGAPTGGELDDALLQLWTKCADRGKAVMAHSGHSMGKDTEYEDMAGPMGWGDLLAVMSNQGKLPRVNAGHFGGDANTNAWTEDIARLMSKPEGAAMFADLGYWDGLRCSGAAPSCEATKRLAQVARAHPIVAGRVMYGSDWLMLSQERRWDRFPFDVLSATTSTFPDADALFGGNAKACFGT